MDQQLSDPCRAIGVSMAFTLVEMLVVLGMI
jgi:type II secretory pathway pseudopilin PulG